MTDKTKSSVKDDANKETLKPKEASGTDQAKIQAAGDDKTSQPAKDVDEKAAIEDGIDTIETSAGANTPTEEGDTVGASPVTALDAVKVKELIDQIENAGGQSTMDLAHRLMQEEGLKPVEGEADAKLVTMAGVRCRATDNPGATLQNWCNAARRALLKAA